MFNFTLNISYTLNDTKYVILAIKLPARSTSATINFPCLLGHHQPFPLSHHQRPPYSQHQPSWLGYDQLSRHWRERLEKILLEYITQSHRWSTSNHCHTSRSFVNVLPSFYPWFGPLSSWPGRSLAWSGFDHGCKTEGQIPYPHTKLDDDIPIIRITCANTIEIQLGLVSHELLYTEVLEKDDWKKMKNTRRQ